MEEEKAAAYYEELTRKGEGAARFKQGLGYSSSSSSKPPPPPSSSSFLSSFVRASSPSSAAKFEKEAQLHNIQTKLNKSKPIPSATHSHDADRDLGHRHRRHRSSRDDDYQDREESSRRRRRERDGRISSSRRHRSCSSDEDRSHRRGRRSRSRSSSPRPERSERREGRRVEGRTERNASRETNVDYSLLIPGYDEMVSLDFDDIKFYRYLFSFLHLLLFGWELICFGIWVKIVLCIWMFFYCFIAFRNRISFLFFFSFLFRPCFVHRKNL